MDLTQVILVDVHDRQTGVMEKIDAHRKGVLHRAFSIFIFNSRGEMLLQQRAASKYHSGGLWTNACCSHPAPGEETETAAQRRLKEELGFETPVEKAFDFVYQAGFDNGLMEHEFDHVFTGQYDGEVIANPAEVMDICYRSITAIRDSIEKEPGLYTSWFRIAFPKIEHWWRHTYNDKLV